MFRKREKTKAEIDAAFVSASRRTRRIAVAIGGIAAALDMFSKSMMIALEYQVVRRRIKGRIDSEGLVQGRDDVRAQHIADEELARYRAKHANDLPRTEITVPDRISPWDPSDDGEQSIQSEVEHARSWLRSVPLDPNVS